MKNKTGLLFLLPLIAALSLAGCGGSGGASGTPPDTTTTPVAVVNAIGLGASAYTVKGDNSDSVTLSISAVDKANAALKDVTITLAASSGFLSASTVKTDSTGIAKVTYSSGSTDKTNRTATITATAQDKTATVPIQVIGSTVSVSVDRNTGNTGTSLNVKALVKDAAGTPMNAQNVKFSVKGAGSGTLSATSGTTDTNGMTPEVILLLTGPGEVSVIAEWLDASGGTTAQSSVVVTAIGVAAGTFDVVSPAGDWPKIVLLGKTQVISLSVPTQINGQEVAGVRFGTTIGTWSNGGSLSTKVPAAGVVTETILAGANSGLATLQFAALGANGAVLQSIDNKQMVMTAATATKVDLQTSVTSVAPSTGTTLNTATLIATARDANNNTVANVPVLFGLLSTTGTGESISPAVVVTDATGKANATFTSGSQATAGGITVRASLIDPVTSATIASTTKAISINQKAASITLGAASKIAVSNDNTVYDWPITVLVVDNTGAAVGNQVVTLAAFPAEFRVGPRFSCYPAAARSSVPNCYDYVAEDTRSSISSDVENDILDIGEDVTLYQYGGARCPISTTVGAVVTIDAPVTVASTANGLLDPPRSAAGSVPTTVTTDENGVATFNLKYLKRYAGYIKSRITASVVVAGTESRAVLNLDLAPINTDVEPNCQLPDGSLPQ